MEGRKEGRGFLRGIPASASRLLSTRGGGPERGEVGGWLSPGSHRGTVLSGLLNTQELLSSLLTNNMRVEGNATKTSTEVQKRVPRAMGLGVGGSKRHPCSEGESILQPATGLLRPSAKLYNTKRIPGSLKLFECLLPHPPSLWGWLLCGQDSVSPELEDFLTRAF